MLERPIPDNKRFGVCAAARELGMPLRTFQRHLSPVRETGKCRYTLPTGSDRKIIYGKWLKEFYYSKMGKDLPVKRK